jgi:PAS domain S-box-containing protein
MPLRFPTIALVALACLTILGLQGWVEWEARTQQLQATEAALLNLASSLTQQADDTIDIADTAVAGVVVGLETGGASPGMLASLSQRLVAQVATANRFADIVVLGADGDWLATSASIRHLNFADRDYFRHHRDNPDPGLFVGPPVRNRLNGRWIITVSRRFNQPDGRFAGVVLATIDLAYFADHYGQYDLGPGGSITLAETDGVMLARYPSNDRFVGESYLSSTLHQAMREHSSGNYSAVSIIDGVRRYTGFLRSDKHPLVVVVAMSHEHALAAWRAAAGLHMAITLILSVAIGLLGLHLLRQVRRSRAAEEAFRRSEAFLDRANGLSGVGGWEIDLPSNTVSWSAETHRIYGLDPGQMPTLEQAIDFFAPDARPVIAEAFERCAIQGEGWDLELPFVRADGCALWVRSVGSVVIANGKPARVTGALQDITDRVVERLALQTANERVNLATDSGRIGIWDWDIVNDTMVWDAWMYRLHGTGQPAGKQTYELWRQQLHPEDVAAAEQAVRDAMDGLRPYLTEFRVLWADGSVHYIRASGSVIRDAGGAAVRMFGANWDVTKLAEQNLLLARAEQEAAAAGAQYRLLADNSSDMVVVLDRQFIRRYVSPSCRELLGYEPEELVGKAGDLILHPDDVEHVMAAFQELLTKPGHDRDCMIYRLRHRDGHWVWVESMRRVLSYDAAGAPMEICSALRDVTQRVAAETALRDSEERYRLLLESGMFEALYMLDPTGTIETWNAGAERLKGYTPAEIIGQNFSTFFTPEDAAAGEPARLLAVARDNGSLTTTGWRVRKGGGRFFARVEINAMHREDGTLRGFAKVTHDVTAQRVEEEQRAIIIEAAPNGMMIVDEAGIITLANSNLHQIFGYPRGSLVGQSPEVLVPEAFSSGSGALRSAFSGGRSASGRSASGSEGAMAAKRPFIGHKRDGGAVSIEIMLSPVETPRGAIVVASLFDVTERQRQLDEQRDVDQRMLQASAAANATLDTLARHLAKARDLADAANRAKSRFLAGMSHELRTPLNGILGYAQLLHMEGGLTKTQGARVDAMLGAGKHLLQMITRVLDLSEIESEHVELRSVGFDVQLVAETCLDLMRPAAEAKGLALGMVVAPGTPPELVADATRVRQVLLNLLGNAVKFTSQGSVELRLRPSAGGAELRIEVVDTGAGIPDEQRKRLFQEFERLDTEATRAAEGAGLGLSLSARLAAMMGGRLGHEHNPGGGSVFWLELPLNTDAITPATAADEADAKSAPSPVRTLNVLVVDDVFMNRDIAGSFLRSAGHQVTLAEGGAEAVAAVADTDFDVVLMDVQMPEMDGLEATLRIRALEGPRGRVPIIALTAQAFTEQVAACQDAGMDSHLAKPFEIDALLAAVARAAATGPRVGKQVSMPAAPLIDLELPVLDPKAFERTAVHLSPETVTAHLKTIAEQGETLLHRLHKPDALTQSGDALAEAAHQLAGSAGMLGFERLAAAGRAFERAIQSGTADAPALADRMGAATEATCQEIYARTP